MYIYRMYWLLCVCTCTVHVHNMCVCVRERGGRREGERKGGRGRGGREWDNWKREKMKKGGRRRRERYNWFYNKNLTSITPLNGYSPVAMETSPLPSNQPCVRSLRENLVLYPSEAGTVVETLANSSSLPLSLSLTHAHSHALRHFTCH